MEELMIERCNMRKEIKIRHIRRWTIQIMRGLVFLHHNGIAHYDMKGKSFDCNDLLPHILMYRK